MKKYLLINHYSWDGDWGVSQSLIFDSKREAYNKAILELQDERLLAEADGAAVVNATDKDNGYLEQEYQKLNGEELFYWEDFGDSIIFARYGLSSAYHIEWTIQEINID